MIGARDAIRTARALLGTPYGELDCIGLIVRVIRTAPGGVPGYRTAGTNTLWRSVGSAPKYRDLTWRQEGTQGARAGMLAFKVRGEDIHHVGLVTGEGTVIHSSSAKGCVVETELGGTWGLLARHRYIEAEALSGPSGQLPLEGEPWIAEVGGSVDQPPPVGGGGTALAVTERAGMATLYKARVTTERDPLRVRDEPGTGRVIGHVPRGATVDVLTWGEWPCIRYGALVGYVSGAYVRRVEEDPSTAAGGDPSASLRSAPPLSGEASERDQGSPERGAVERSETEGYRTTTSLVREDGVCIVLCGKWRVASD